MTLEISLNKDYIIFPVNWRNSWTCSLKVTFVIISSYSVGPLLKQYTQCIIFLPWGHRCKKSPAFLLEFLTCWFASGKTQDKLCYSLNLCSTVRLPPLFTMYANTIKVQAPTLSSYSETSMLSVHWNKCSPNLPPLIT